MAGELIFSATDIGSRRSLIIANEGASAWAYLSAPSSIAPVSDTWLLNTINAPENLDAYRQSQNVPPATRQFTSQPVALELPGADEIAAAWSSDGEAVAVLIRGRVIAFLLASQPRGYSRFLILDGPFGNRFDPALFEKAFGHPDATQDA